MSESAPFPAPNYLLAVAARPEELLLRMGGMISSFADRGTTVHAVLLSDGLPANASPKERVDRNHRSVLAARRIGVTEVIMLEHPVADVPRTGVDLMAGEVLGAMERADAVLVADPNERGDRSSRGRLATFRAALRIARVIGAAIYVCTTVRPGPRASPYAIEVEVSRASQRSAIAAFEGLHNLSRLHPADERDVEYLLFQPRREPALRTAVPMRA